MNLVLIMKSSLFLARLAITHLCESTVIEERGENRWRRDKTALSLFLFLTFDLCRSHYSFAYLLFDCTMMINGYIILTCLDDFYNIKRVNRDNDKKINEY